MKPKKTIELRGGTGNQIVITKTTGKAKPMTAAEKRKKAELEAAIDAEAAGEVAAMKQHKEIRPDVQKLG